MRNTPDLVIITGMSGAGRTDAMHSFEDMGYYCIDNLPPILLEEVVALARRNEADPQRLAVVCDIRSYDFLSTLRNALTSLTEHGYNYELLFMDASDEKIINRFKASRRKHPLAKGGSVATGIKNERELLASTREMSNVILDTSQLTTRELTRKINELYSAGRKGEKNSMDITVGSFGYKYGIPNDADLVIDVRFLSNPYYIDELKPLTGLDAPVRDFVLEKEETKEFLAKWFDMLDLLIPAYRKEGKRHLYIAVGCTGGQHRSVAIAEATADYLKTNNLSITVLHRNIPKKANA